MPARVFTDILAKGVREGQIPARSKAAREWYRREARKTKATAQREILTASGDRERTNSVIGRMYIFSYLAKHRDTLPYWDRYPVVFPFSKRRGLWTGINFHYLPYPQRAVLMDRLYDLRNNDRYDQSTKLQLSYDVLNTASRYRYFKPTIHSYLTSHVQSRLILIDPADWDVAIFLPIAFWRKKSQAEVWADSRRKLGLKPGRRATK